MKPARLTLALLATACLLAAGVVAGARADVLLKRDIRAGARELIYLPPPATARLLSLGFNQVVADWYWVKTIQYFADPVQALNRYRNLGDILDVVVAVDPDYEYAYKFGALAIPYDVGRLKWANTEKAIDLLQRGVARFPRNWELHFFLGFYLLNFQKDPAAAAEHFAIAAQIPGSPPYLKLFATRLFSAGGELERAQVFAQTMLDEAQDPLERKQLEERIKSIRREMGLRKLEEAARRYHEEKGRWPASTAELSAAYGLPPAPPGVTIQNGVLQTPPDWDRLAVFEHPVDGEYKVAQ
ncbi:MAG TPA: hypothetical protein VGG91_23930 [Myxococcaceae bacterium]